MTAFRPETANGCLVLRTAGTLPRGTTRNLDHANTSPRRLSTARQKGTPVCPIDFYLSWMSPFSFLYWNVNPLNLYVYFHVYCVPRETPGMDSVGVCDGSGVTSMMISPGPIPVPR